ncbi:MAG: hypothetical protein MR296_05830 [Tenericutes bacterium]|nr:hypothetical protein [Mycoplasmatota bacterium]
MKRKSLLKASSLALSAIIVLSGCSAGSNSGENVTFSYTDEDLNNFVTDKKINNFNWYVIETFEDGENKLKITKETTITKMGNGVTRYYYTDVLKEDYIVYSVLYDKDAKTYWVETGPDIISATPLVTYLDKYNMRKASYSKDDINTVYEKIKKDYNEKKELDKKGKVLLKDKPMY